MLKKYYDTSQHIKSKKQITMKQQKSISLLWFKMGKMYFISKRAGWHFKWVKAEADHFPLIEPSLIIAIFFQNSHKAKPRHVFPLLKQWKSTVLICPELNSKQKQLCRTTVATEYANTAALMFFSQRHEKQDLCSSS